MSPRFYTIPAGIAFADALARGLIERTDAERDPLALASATIYLPTQRAARTLGETFARVLKGAALLPQLRALGDIDEEENLFDAAGEDLSTPPAIDPVRRRLLLATLVRRWAERRGHEKPGFAQAAALARSLARFLDEVETQQPALVNLEQLAPQSLATHWADVCDFLLLLRDEWPTLLEPEGAIDPAQRRNILLAQLARRYRERPPSSPVIAAGTTGSIPATADLLSAIARLPQGAVVLPALDREMDADSWERLDPGHPQYGMRQLLERVGVARDEVQDWPGVAAPSKTRAWLLRETLRPAPTTDAWRALADKGDSGFARGLNGMSIVTAAHPAEEALAIALMLREAAEDPARTAALVTPDRNLARRVGAELRRWDIAIDDSAGTPLAQTPPAVFLALLAQATQDGFSPVPLLALLKHPLAACGEQPATFRRNARRLDRYVLRGPRPDPGLKGLRRALEAARIEAGETRRAQLIDELSAWFADLAARLGPFADAMSLREAALPELACLHRDAAQSLAATPEDGNAARLWSGEAGEAAAELLETLARAGEDLPPIEPSSYPVLFRQLAGEKAIRPPFGRHPRLAILGPLEARLQHFDLVVLGGLNEGIWPQAAPADPWLSRPMRETIGLESPERAIGLAAHDFETLAAAPRVIFTRSLKVDGTPTIASRWLQRLEQLTSGLGLSPALVSDTPYDIYARIFATPDRIAAPIARPQPRPPVAKRPRELSVTAIETWIRDPYAVYARHVLGLKPLDPLAAEIGPLERGSAMHEILELFMKEDGAVVHEHATARLIAIAEEVFARRRIPQSALALWRPRFARAASWFVAEERRQRAEIARSFLEIEGRIGIEGPAGMFTLKCRADRIDQLRRGGAAIIDYKTGKPRTDPQVGVFAPQLPLEGAILERGGFAEIGALETSQLVYIRFAGGAVAGDRHVVKGDAHKLVADTLSNLMQRIADFDRETTPYISSWAPFRTDQAGDYDHLARVREWRLSGWSAE
ncbi:MAG TPA: double-strand break repair protein AddB [Rhizomicrobium sp.]|jgi:ATP-dependent helicase/nuclease subunit B